MPFLVEGLYSGDLENLVSDTISIDEFESKIDNDAIVVGFFVKREEPAHDLSRFIENGSYSILDTEVSPATDEDGNYVVFVEFLRDEFFYTTLKRILEDIKNLTNISSWRFVYYNSDETLQFNKKNIEKHIRLKKESRPSLKEHHFKAYEFLHDSLLSDVTFNGNSIKLSRDNYGTKVYEYVAVSDLALVTHLLKLDSYPTSLLESDLKECNQIRTLLGDNWSVTKMNKYFVVRNHNDPDKALILK